MSVGMSVVGFSELTDDGCLRLRATYADALDLHARGEVNYPCGSPARSVRRWLRELDEEIGRRGLA